MLDRRLFLALAGAMAAAALRPGQALAHHGWQWASDEEFTLTGIIREVRLGNPHGLLTVEAADRAMWIAEIGQP